MSRSRDDAVRRGAPMSGLEWVLLISIVLALYPLAGYPLVIALIGAVRPRRGRRASHQPTVTVLIPAFNEADCIGRTVQNKLDQDYPADKLQIVVVSDQSDDGTD